MDRPPARGAVARGGRGGARARHAPVPRRGRCGSWPSPAASACTAAATCCWCPPGDAREAIERFYRRRARAEIGAAAGRRDRARGHALQGPDDPRPAHALGVVLLRRRDVVQLAAAARARGRPRLRDRARGLPPRGDGPLAALLGAARVARARLARPRGLAAPLRLDARASEPAPAAARRRRPRPAPPPTSSRRSRPVQASDEPSPRTSTPARRRRGPRSSIRAVTCWTGSKRRTRRSTAAGAARRPPRDPRLEQVERLGERARSQPLDLRPAAHRDAERRHSADLLEQRRHGFPARDLAAVAARERPRDGVAAQRPADPRGLRAAEDLGAGDVRRDRPKSRGASFAAAAQAALSPGALHRRRSCSGFAGRGPRRRRRARAARPAPAPRAAERPPPARSRSRRRRSAGRRAAGVAAPSR